MAWNLECGGKRGARLRTEGKKYLARLRFGMLGIGLLLGVAHAAPQEDLRASAGISAPSNASLASEIRWADYQGKVVLIDFWASWCGPCRASFPWMNAMQKKYGAEGLVILAVNVDENPDNAAAFLREVPANFEVRYDPKGRLAEQFKVQTMPSSFILNRQGAPASKHLGFHLSEVGAYEQELQQLLQQR